MAIQDRVGHIWSALGVGPTVITEPPLLVVRVTGTDRRRLVTADATPNIRHLVAGQQPNRRVAIVGCDTEPAVVVVALDDAKRQLSRRPEIVLLGDLHIVEYGTDFDVHSPFVGLAIGWAA